MRSWFIAAGVLGLAVALVPFSARSFFRHGATTHSSDPALSHVVALGDGDASTTGGPGVVPGLSLVHIGLGDDGATAPVGPHGLAHLTVDPELQRAALSMMAALHLPEAAVVLMDAQSGEVLAYASHLEHGALRDLCAEAAAPAASVFKIVTAAALVDDAGLGADTRQCYSGGEQKILPSDLVEDALRDRWCVTLAGAMGRSVNAVFARLAQKNLTPAALEEKARSFGFGESPSFDVPVEASALHVPAEPLAFARTAAGFWNTTLSPLHAAWISAAVARGGEAVRPTIVRDGSSAPGVPLPAPSGPAPVRRVVSTATAQTLTTMMERTVSEGTSYRAFHDAKGTPFLPGITVAGKTGTLTDDHAHRFYTWFTGFAPSHPLVGVRTVVIATLVVNEPTWRVKANVIAREMLRAYFVSQKVAGVTHPKIEPIAVADE